MLQKGKVSVTLSKFMNRVRRAVFKWFHCEQIFFNNTFYIIFDVNPSPVITPPPPPPPGQPKNIRYTLLKLLK